jgi:hypothetical protein
LAAFLAIPKIGARFGRVLCALPENHGAKSEFSRAPRAFSRAPRYFSSALVFGLGAIRAYPGI